MSSIASPVLPGAKPKKRNTLLIVLLVLGGLVGGLAIVGIMLKKKGAGLVVTTEKAVVKTITQLVTATGRIQPEIEVKIFAEVGGEIIGLPVVEGQRVKQGDLLARFKPDLYKAQLEQQQAAVATARARVVQSEASAEKTQLDFAQVETLFKRGLVTETEFNASRSALRVAEANLEASRADRLRAEGALRQSEDQLSKTTVYAPRDGTVSILNSKLGERVVAQGQFSGTEIMRLADLDTMEVRVNVNENDVVNVKVGDTARVRIDAFQGRDFRAVVREIANTARTSGLGSADEVTNFEVRISIKEPGVQLRPGMSATADIETKVAANVVAVPSQSVTVRTKDKSQTAEEVQGQRNVDAAQKQNAGAANAVNEAQRREQERLDRENLQRVVFVRNGDKARMQKVETGLVDNTHTQIVSGLIEGDEVISGPYRVITQTLKDGAVIKIQPPKKDEKKPEEKKS